MRLMIRRVWVVLMYIRFFNEVSSAIMGFIIAVTPDASPKF